MQETIAEMARRNKAAVGDETQRFSTYVQQVSLIIEAIFFHIAYSEIVLKVTDSSNLSAIGAAHW